MNLRSLEVMVLAGGRGTRLSGVVADRPKVMADVNGRPFLDFVLDHLQQQGVCEITLLTGYMADQIEDHYGLSYGAISLRYSRETSPLGTGGAVKLALKRLPHPKPLSLILNGDTYFPADLQAAASWPVDQVNRILATRVPDVFRYGSLEIVPNSGRVLRFIEKGERRTGVISAGTYILESALIEAFPAPIFSLETDLLQPLAASGRLVALEDGAPFIDIGIPDDYSTFRAMHYS